MKPGDIVSVVVKNPAAGLLTDEPSNLRTTELQRHIVAASNVRAEGGSVQSAVGHESVKLTPGIDTPASLVTQAVLLGGKPVAVIGTATSVYGVRRRSSQKFCAGDVEDNPDPNDGGPGIGYNCRTVFAFLSDTQNNTEDAQTLFDLVDSFSPDFVLHGGDFYDLSPAPTPTDELLGIVEDHICRVFHPWLPGYRGAFGSNNLRKLFAALGNHDVTDLGSGTDAEWRSLFGLNSTDPLYYTFRRGAVQFYMLDTTAADLTNTSEQAVWLQAAKAASTATWHVVVAHYPPFSSRSGYSAPTGFSAWDFKGWGFDLVFSGHVHRYERITAPKNTGIPMITCGLGNDSSPTWGAALDSASAKTEYRDETDGCLGFVKVLADQSALQAQYYRVVAGVATLVDVVTLRQDTPGTVCATGLLGQRGLDFTVLPSSPQDVVSGQTISLRAVLLRWDGSLIDVSSVSLWGSDNSRVASVAQTGVVTGVSPGMSFISAEYRNPGDVLPWSAGTSIRVTEPCRGNGSDFMLLVDVSAAASEKSSAFRSRLEILKEGLLALISGLDPDSDRVGLVVYGGDYASQTPSVRTLSPLTSDFTRVKTAVNSLSAQGGSAGYAGVVIAGDNLEVGGSTAQQRVLVHVILGPANIGPSADVTASLATNRTAAMADVTTAYGDLSDDIVKVVVAWNMGDWTSSIAAWANSEYDFLSTTETGFIHDLAALPSRLCSFGYDIYYNTVSVCEGGQPRLNFRNFTNWNVVSGSVDQHGTGTTGLNLFDLAPRAGSGLYIDLAGSPGVGALESKSAFTFEPGERYRLSVDLAGSSGNTSSPYYRGPQPDLTTRLTVGGLLTSTDNPWLDVTVPEASDWQTYQFEFLGPAGSGADWSALGYIGVVGPNVVENTPAPITVAAVGSNMVRTLVAAYKPLETINQINIYSIAEDNLDPDPLNVYLTVDASSITVPAGSAERGVQMTGAWVSSNFYALVAVATAAGAQYIYKTVDGTSWTTDFTTTPGDEYAACPRLAMSSGGKAYAVLNQGLAVKAAPASGWSEVSDLQPGSTYMDGWYAVDVATSAGNRVVVLETDEDDSRLFVDVAANFSSATGTGVSWTRHSLPGSRTSGLWTPQGARSGSAKNIAISASGSVIAVAAGSNDLFLSRDGGLSWQGHPVPGITHGESDCGLLGVTISADGAAIAVVVQSSDQDPQILVSALSGDLSWTTAANGTFAEFGHNSSRLVVSEPHGLTSPWDTNQGAMKVWLPAAEGDSVEARIKIQQMASTEPNWWNAAGNLLDNVVLEHWNTSTEQWDQMFADDFDDDNC